MVDQLQADVKIVDGGGTATSFFIRQWNALIKLATDTAAALAAATSAQTTADGKVSKAGDTMTGTLTIATGNLTVTAGTIQINGVVVIDNARSIQLRNYATGALPAAPATDGLLAYDSTLGNPVYSKAGAWTNIGTGGGGGSGSKYMGYERIDVNAGTIFGTGNWGGRDLVCSATVTLNSIKFVATVAAPTAQVRAIIYADTGALAPGAELAQSNVVTGVVLGLNTLNLTAGLAVNEGDMIWIGIQLNVVNMTVATGGGLGTVFFATVGNTVQNPAPVVTFTNQGWSSMWASQ